MDQMEFLINNEQSKKNISDLDKEYDDDILLNYGENSKTKYNIVLCEHYNGRVHGTMNHLEDKFLVISRFKEYDYEYISDMADFYNHNYADQFKQLTPHSIIRNYKNIITNENYIQPEIAECHYLPGGECVCVKKTFWLRIFQRKLKNMYKKKRD